jgi:putative ABC transport system permease protein
MFLALRDLRRSWRRFLLVGLVVALVAVLSTALGALANGLVSSGTSGIAGLPFDHMAFQPGSLETFSRSTLGPTALATWSSTPGVKATPVGMSFVNAAPVNGKSSIDVALFGVEPGSFLLKRPDARAAMAGRPGLVLASSFAKQGITVGQRFMINGFPTPLPVLGFTFGGSYGHVPIGFTSLATWQRIAYRTDPGGRHSALALDVPSSVSIPAIDATAGTATVTKAGTYAGSPGYSAETSTMTLIRAFLLIISALIVGSFFTILIVQRTPQIGLLKAMGASSWFVIKDGLGQMALVVTAATVAGTAIGAGLTALLEGGAVPIELTASGVLGSALLLIVTGIIGALVPFRRITSVAPSLALKAGA